MLCSGDLLSCFQRHSAATCCSGCTATSHCAPVSKVEFHVEIVFQVSIRRCFEVRGCEWQFIVRTVCVSKAFVQLRNSVEVSVTHD